MKIYFYFFLILSFFTSCTLGQVFIEKRIGLGLESSNVGLQFEGQDYVDFKLNDSEKIYYQQNNPLNHVTTEKNGEDLITVTIELSNYPNEKFIHFLNEDGFYHLEPVFDGDSKEVDVPIGIYDIIVTSGNTLVAKELIPITSNTLVSFNRGEASNEVIYDSYNDSGELIRTNENASFLLTTSGVIYNPTNTNFVSITTTGSSNGPHFKYFISNVSERYSIFHSSYSIGLNKKIYVPKHPLTTGVTENKVVTNSSSDWIEFQENSIALTKGIQESNGDVYKALSLHNALNGYKTNVKIIWFLDDFNFNESINYIFNKEINDVQKVLIEQVLIEGTNIGTTGNLIVSTPTDIAYGSGASSGISDFDIILYFQKMNGKARSYPFHEKFSLLTSHNSHYTQGKTVPIFVTGFVDFYKFKLSALGRMGENQGSHPLFSTMEIYRNSDLIFQGSIDEQTPDYFLPTTQNKIILTNENTNVGGLIGRNITELVYSDLTDDKVPPTLQMLQFRGEDNKIKEIFSVGEIGSIRLAAGDFYLKYVNGAEFGYYPGNTVQLFYSKYNQENWIELGITKVSEYFQMPRFGDYYEASLAQINEPEINVWYDLKIVCTDAAGNSQTQTISPAFKINNTLGIEENTHWDFVVYPNPFKDQLYIQLPEKIKGNFTFKVMDLSGKLIDSFQTDKRNFNWNGSHLPKGVYIISLEQNGKVLSERILKK